MNDIFDALVEAVGMVCERCGEQMVNRELHDTRDCPIVPDEWNDAEAV